ncbi:MAG: serine hydrolase, partial [Saprospiraceae bacterium]|nr:serine hydrolase [Saprospiraceae bacterium]
MKKYLLSAVCTLLIFCTVLAQPWMQYATPEEAGWSGDLIEEAWEFADEIGSAAFMLIYDGKVVAQHGDITRRFMCHSVRKSLLSALYGIYVGNGAINLDRTLADLGVDDVHQLTEQEKSATIRDMLKARSGVFHPAAYETEAMKLSRPARGSHPPNTFWYYNNWDFNTSCAILMQHTGKDFFKDFKEKIADPVGMQDFRLSDTYYHLEAEHSQYPAYPFRMSARDLARIGQLFLQQGEWNGQQLLPADWIEESTTPYSYNTRREGQGYAYMWWTGLYGNAHALGLQLLIAGERLLSIELFRQLNIPTPRRCSLCKHSIFPFSYISNR